MYVECVFIFSRHTVQIKSCWCAVIRTGAEPGILSFITILKSRLADIIEPDFGLLDELLRLELLSRRQYDDVRSERRAAYRRSEAVLDLLTSESQCGKFVDALQRTHQQHVANFITQNGGQKQWFRSWSGECSKCWWTDRAYWQLLLNYCTALGLYVLYNRNQVESVILIVSVMAKACAYLCRHC